MIAENTLTKEAKNKFNKFKEIEKTVHGEILVYRTNEYTYSFKTFRTINTFGRDIYNGLITTKEADKNRSSLLVEIINFKSKIKPPNLEKKQINKDVFKILHALFDARERFLDAFESRTFPKKLKVQIFQTLTILISKY